jgi:hypothetical protein
MTADSGIIRFRWTIYNWNATQILCGEAMLGCSVLACTMSNWMIGFVARDTWQPGVDATHK